MKLPSNVNLFAGEEALPLSLPDIRDYLQGMFPDVVVRIKDSVFSFAGDNDRVESTARELAGLKVTDLTTEHWGRTPLYGEISYEERILAKKCRYSPGILYDGVGLMLMFKRLLPEPEEDSASIIFTDRLFGTFDKDDLRYHARVILCGFPSVISTSGLVEAPAKPREFYKLKQTLTQAGIGIPIEGLKQQFQGQFIDYGDERTTEVLKGFVLQALLNHIGLAPFCKDPACRLYNAHWQADLIRAQLEHPEFCSEHKRILEGLA